MMGRPGGGMARGAATGRPGQMRPAERTKDLRGTLRRLLSRLRPERAWLEAAGLLGVTSVGFMVAGPKILGSATNILFDGLVGQQLPKGLSQAQVVALLRAHGEGQLASMLGGMTVTPGVGVDITRLGQVLGVAALVYLLGAAFNFGQGYVMAGVTQRAMYGLRREVEDKLARLPLRYFEVMEDGRIVEQGDHNELLSRRGVYYSLYTSQFTEAPAEPS